ncbi:MULTISPECIES: hypothetical protein [Microcystis]|nr:MULTISPECIES: hypothetical protein [Microcystis]MCA2897668.1 hypothetical protein [Microcystis sp. M039S1]MCA2899776.1 hypothetical protein [Microcystis sp. M035S1]MCA2722575.1 hypothetical protein [Microcystis sp. M176S2]MCA2725017.1 hypothetical protein [Microcystis sp. M166S2]MCA2730642.1 hypothetical protein [Microcystis sp. M162S2]
MYIEKVPNRNSPPAVLRPDSYREGDQVKKRTLANLSKLPDDIIDNLKLALKGALQSRYTLDVHNLRFIKLLKS